MYVCIYIYIYGNHVGRFRRTGCTGTLVQVHGLHHLEQRVYFPSGPFLVGVVSANVVSTLPNNNYIIVYNVVYYVILYDIVVHCIIS